MNDTRSADSPDQEGLIAASTVLLIRDGPDGLEVLMVRRNSKIAFGGMWVFPGGRVDEEEVTDDPLESAGLAAVRETLEETGLSIAESAMHTWSHWQPPPARDMAARAKGPIRRFSTWFFVTRAPEGEVSIDHGEIHEHAWLTPAEALQLHRNGETELAPPTWISLYQLDAHNTVDEAMAWAQDEEPSNFWTRPISKDPLVLAWEGDVSYEGLPATTTGPRNRLTLDPQGWHYERS